MEQFVLERLVLFVYPEGRAAVCLLFACIAMNVLKLLFNPIFLLAAGLHAGLLLIPVAGGSSDSTVPAPDPEGESITVTRIPPKARQAGDPARPPASVTPAAARPVTATAVRPAVSQTTEPTKTGRPQSRQSSSGERSSASGRSSSNSRRQATANRSGTNQSAQTASRNSSSEIAVLPADSSDRPSNNTTANQSSGNTQAAPTLVALKDGVQSQTVPEMLQAFLARLQHSVLGTTEPEVEEAKQAWLATLSEQPGLTVSATHNLEKAIEISYPFIADEDGRRFLSCLTPVPKKGIVGVVVGADSKFVTEPVLLRSLGYGFLNEIAIEKVNAYTDFPEEGSQKAYTIEVEIDYDEDACVELAELKK